MKLKSILLILFYSIGLFIGTTLIAEKIDREEKFEKYKGLMAKQCYIAGDFLNNFICDCYIENYLKDDPEKAYFDYLKKPLEIIEEVHDKYYDTCLEKTLNASLDGEINGIKLTDTLQ